jgi:hypothetical protein
MTTRQKIRNLGQHPRLLRDRRDTCVYASAVSIPTLTMTYSAPHFDPQEPSLHVPLHCKSHRQSAISQTDRQIQSP